MGVWGELIRTIECGDELGEGVAWRPSDQSLWWTDIQGRRLHRIDWGTDAHSLVSLPERLCSFGFVEGDDDRLVCAFESGFAWFSPATGTLDWIARPLAGVAGMRFNDGRIGPDGRFWAGTMAEPGGRVAAGRLYSLDRAGMVREHRDRIGIPNATCWSPQGDRMYFADLARSEIEVIAFDPAEGKLGAGRIVARIEDGAPDGAVTDTQGRLWNAVWSGARVEIRSPEGGLLGVLPVPARQPTCPVFGGPDLDLLFVTSAWEHLTAAERTSDPQAGNLFVYRTNARGLAPWRFGGGIRAC